MGIIEMKTNNCDLPAMPVIEESKSEQYNGATHTTATDISFGLTKREMFCLHNGVADTGDAELDAIIRKGNLQKAAMAAMQGMLANGDGYDSCALTLAEFSAKNAAAILAELEKQQ